MPIAAEVLKAAGVYDKRKLLGVSTLDVVRSRSSMCILTASEQLSQASAFKLALLSGWHRLPDPVDVSLFGSLSQARSAS